MSETLHQAIERILDEESAWVARPSEAVTTRIALAAAMKASTIEADHAECGATIDDLSTQVARLKEEKHALMAALGRQCGAA